MKVALSFSLIAITILLCACKFTLAVPTQEYSCLRASYFLVDKTSVTPERESLIAFYLPVDTPYFRKNTRWIKKVVGIPGDDVTVTVDAVYVNGMEYRNNMNTLLMKVGMKPDQVTKDLKLEDDQYFVIGETPLSYDSRFWGVIGMENMIGDAYAIL
ncbi:signal peptidase I [Shewanella algae]|nr:signal peptidase I [Shewanella algae]MBO2656109.1 signal peptidase I [Shewanella algae]